MYANQPICIQYLIKRRIVCGQLMVLKGNNIIPWCFGGHFNEIKSFGEWLGCSSLVFGMRDFQDFTNVLELRVLQMHWWNFSWSYFHERSIQSRLVSFIFSEWLDHFHFHPLGFVMAYFCHCPVLVDVASKVWDLILFIMNL